MAEEFPYFGHINVRNIVRKFRIPKVKDQMDNENSHRPTQITKNFLWTLLLGMRRVVADEQLKSAGSTLRRRASIQRGQ